MFYIYVYNNNCTKRWNTDQQSEKVRDCLLLNRLIRCLYANTLFVFLLRACLQICPPMQGNTSSIVLGRRIHYPGCVRLPVGTPTQRNDSMVAVPIK